MRWLLLFVLTSLSLSAAPVSFYYGANRQGEVDPCGCPVNQNGGVARLATYFASRKRDPKASFFGDAGDTFFSNATLPGNLRAEELPRARTLARAFRLLGLDVLTPGERDLAAGLVVLRELETASGAAFVSANLRDAQGKPLFPSSTVVRKAGLRIGVVGAIDPEALPKDSSFHAEPALPAVARAADELTGQVDMLVLLSHLGLKADREVAKSGKFDLVIGSHSLDALAEPEPAGRAWIVQPMYQGQQAGSVEWDPAARKWVGSALVDLDTKWNGANEVLRLIAAEKKRRQTAAVAAAKPRRHGPRDFVAHAAECRACHAKQVDFWETTKHASAYLVLYAKNQHFDPECIGCHSLGFARKGGFSRIAEPFEIQGEAGPGFADQLMSAVFAEDGPRRPLDSRTEPDRFAKLKARYHDRIHALEAEKRVERIYAGVQCEHCHGNRSSHLKDHQPGKKVVETTCRGCHRAPRAPEFRSEMIELVRCPKG